MEQRNMEYLKVKTKGNGSPQGKTRVYFTCHPDDVEKYLEPVCRDLFDAVDCAVYYTSDMTAPIPEENKETDLGRINLFVIPVSLKLLTTTNRAMKEDYPFAKSHHIPVLPLMMEDGLESIYSRQDRFGELQYLQPGVTDNTAIPYEEKLKKYLSSVLIDSETAERVRAAFDAYIFLSYRKKDRVHANELMRLIHRNPICRDIAIWYDEFLDPGENFNSSIEKALEKSELFTLLITPNLVNENNYVISTEYPMARATGKRVLPVEMVKTDRKQLQENFEGLPEAVDTADEALFRERLLASLERTAKTENDQDPVHNYLIGLAYMEGIDVEVDRERGIALIESAGEAGLEEAIRHLWDIYSKGIGVVVDYRKAAYWAQKLIEECARTKGEEDLETVEAQHDLALVLELMGDSRTALEIEQKVYDAECKILGEEHPYVFTSLGFLATIYSGLGDYQKALELGQKAYETECKVLGEEHDSTLATLGNLVATYAALGEYGKALEIGRKVYEAQCRVLGEEHQDTAATLSDLGVVYGELGEYQKALELMKEAYEKECKAFGVEHPTTISTLFSIGNAYDNLGDKQKALEVNQKAYDQMKRVMGEEDPEVLDMLNNLASNYGELGDQQKALDIRKKVYEVLCRVKGEEHPGTLVALANLGNTYMLLREKEKALEVQEKAYTLFCKVLGEEHPTTIMCLNGLALTYARLGEMDKALKAFQNLCALSCRVRGEEHPDTLIALSGLGTVYFVRSEHEQAREIYEKVYELRRKVLGEEHPDTMASLDDVLDALIFCDHVDPAYKLELLERKYAAQRRTLGEDDPATKETLQRLENVRKKLEGEA